MAARRLEVIGTRTLIVGTIIGVFVTIVALALYANKANLLGRADEPTGEEDVVCNEGTEQSPEDFIVYALLDPVSDTATNKIVPVCARGSITHYECPDGYINASGDEVIIRQNIFSGLRIDRTDDEETGPAIFAILAQDEQNKYQIGVYDELQFLGERVEGGSIYLRARSVTKFIEPISLYFPKNGGLYNTGFPVDFDENGNPTSYEENGLLSTGDLGPLLEDVGEEGERLVCNKVETTPTVDVIN